MGEVQPYIYKSPPYAHQDVCFMRSRDLSIFAILFEMGAGKSKVAVDTAAYLHSRGRIDAMLLVAPNGVHSKWLQEDFPFSWPDWAQYKGAVWEAGNKKAEQACEDLLKPGPHLRVLCMNVETFSTKRGFEFALRFLKSTDALMVVDESSRIKNPEAKRTINICKCGDYAKYRRILTGTPLSNSPFDLYSQFMFLDTAIFGQSYYAFKSQYAEILDRNDPFVTNLMKAKNLKFAPQIVEKDKKTGKAKYKNLDKLKKIIEPYSMRVTKEECLDLPPKIYQTRYFKLPPAHRKAYDQLKTKLKLELKSGEKLTVMHKLTLMLRLQQLASGFMATDTGDLIHLYADPKENPRVIALMDSMEDIQEGGVIIWCRFIEEILMLKKVLGDEAVVYYGDVNSADRLEAKRQFQSGEKKYFLGNTATGGIGINLTEAATVVYYTNDFSYENRKQSEDRAHRIGQEHDHVNYIDLVCEESCDVIIVRSLHNKEELADFVMDLEEWLE